MNERESISLRIINTKRQLDVCKSSIDKEHIFNVDRYKDILHMRIIDTRDKLNKHLDALYEEMAEISIQNMLKEAIQWIQKTLYNY